MPSVGKGVPPPLKLERVLSDLYQNQKTKNIDGTKTRFSFSKAELSQVQKDSLAPSVPAGYEALDFFVVYQITDFDKDGTVTGYKLSLVSFVRKEGFTYGYYFDVTNQQKFEIKDLEKSHKPVEFSDAAVFTTSNYVEVFHDIRGTSVILAFDQNRPYASLQYGHAGRYFYEELVLDGIVQPDLPVTHLTGLSENLED